MLSTQLVRAQEEMTTIIVKDYIDEVKPVELIISVYDELQGGTLLYQLTKPVTPEDGIFFDTIEVPSEILDGYPQVFIEFSKASSPSEPLPGERMEFNQPWVSRDIEGANITSRDAEGLAFSESVSVCFTCGGAWPFTAGAIVAGPFVSGRHNHQRGENCKNPDVLEQSTDPRPQICTAQLQHVIPSHPRQ
jgi:hypothetical protein